MTSKQMRPPAAAPARQEDEGQVQAGATGLAAEGLQAMIEQPARLPGVLEAARAVPNQDVIYEQLARLGAYQQLPAERLAAWGYRQGAVLDRPESGLHAVVFLPLAGAAAPTTPQGHAMLELHGAPVRPVLAFRGARRDQEPMDDYDAQGIGSFQFAANQAEVVAALRGARSRVDVVGHGPGGALAQLAASRHPQAIGRVVTFQAPPIDEQDAELLDAWNQRVAAHQRVLSAHHRSGYDATELPGEARTPGRAWTWGVGNLTDLGQAMPLAQLATARGGGVPGVTGLDGGTADDALVSVTSHSVGRPLPDVGVDRLRQAVAQGLDRRDPRGRGIAGEQQVEQVRQRVVEMATSTRFGFRQIVAYVQGQASLSAQQKVALQEEARLRYRQGR